MHRALALVLLSLLPLAGCTRCSSAKDKSVDAGPKPLLPEKLLPPPASWSFSLVRTQANIAPPSGCTQRAPLVRAKVAPTTRFVAEPRTLGQLIVADAKGTPPRLTGVAALTLDPAGESHDPVALPWIAAGALPRLAKTGSGTWIAAFDQTIDDGMSRVGLWQGGTAVELGQGDAFESADMACLGQQCALFTSRIARVAPPGGLVWLGQAGEPHERWTRVEIIPKAPESDARPFQIAKIHKGAGDALELVVVMLDKDDLVYYRVEAGKSEELGRVPVHHGAIESIALARPIAMVYGTPLDDDGCPKESAPGGGAAIRFERSGAEGKEIRTPAPPMGGFMRPLTRGALATWIAPLGCRQRRQVVYGLLLDDEGVPQSDPMPIGDGESYAVATSGDELDLWLQHEDTVSWLRLNCSVAAKAK